MIIRNKKGQFAIGSKPIAGFKKGFKPSEIHRKRLSKNHRHYQTEDTKRKIGNANSIALKGRHPKSEWKKGQHGSIKTEFKKGKLHLNW